MYNKNKIKQIRSIPTSKEDEHFFSDKDMENFINNILKKRNGKFNSKKNLKGEFPILALIHYNGSVRASGIIESVEESKESESKYIYNFDVSSLKYFKKSISIDDLKHIKLKKLDGEDFERFNQSSMKFDMGCFDKLNELILNHNYEKNDFLKEAFITYEDYESMSYLLKKYKNLILQGPPGVGKTFLAKRLVDSIIGNRFKDQVEMVQFHQSYSYEDFVMGYKPDGQGFKLIEGPFYNFCKKAEDKSTEDFFLIIDEIKRGDLSKIFGELFMLIEDDKRSEDYKIKLIYKEEYFYVPENVYIIGLMNTADRSIAMVDWALRRRFSFYDLKPGFDSENFVEYQKNIGSSSFNKVIEQIKSINESIKEDDSLGDGFCIGHSYFCNLESEGIEKNLRFIIDYKIVPLLKEYWFDDEKSEDIKELCNLSRILKQKKIEGD